MDNILLISIFGIVAVILIIFLFVYISKKLKTRPQSQASYSNSSSINSISTDENSIKNITEEINNIKLPNYIKYDTKVKILENSPQIDTINEQINDISINNIVRTIYKYIYDNRDNLKNLHKAANYTGNLYKNNINNPRHIFENIYLLIHISMLINMHNRNDILNNIWKNVISDDNQRNHIGIKTIIDKAINDIKIHNIQFFSNSDNEQNDDIYKFLDNIK